LDYRLTTSRHDTSPAEDKDAPGCTCAPPTQERTPPPMSSHMTPIHASVQAGRHVYELTCWRRSRMTRMSSEPPAHSTRRPPPSETVSTALKYDHSWICQPLISLSLSTNKYTPSTFLPLQPAGPVDTPRHPSTGEARGGGGYARAARRAARARACPHPGARAHC